MLIDKLFVVGPSRDIENFDQSFFDSIKKQGFKIFCYGDAALYLHKIKVKPDIFCFFDPTTLSHLYKIIEEGFFKESYLLVFDMYSNKCKRFHQVGNSSSLLRNPLEANKFFLIEESLNIYFKKYLKIPFKIKHQIRIRDLFSKFPFRYKHSRSERNLLNCKFSFVVLPLIFFCFKKIKIINIIGFGHYDLSRYISIANRKGYNTYQLSYNKYKKVLIEYIKEKNIKLKFLGRESFYKDLELK